MGKFSKGRSYHNGPGQGIGRAFRQQRDAFDGGHGADANRGFGDNVTRAIWNDTVAPGNNRPGREFLRRGWNNNLAGMASQETANSLFRTPRPKGKRGW
jgi:hypothetical protein